MNSNYLTPDKPLALKYMAAAIVLQVLDYFIPFIGIIGIALFFISIKSFMHAENNFFKKTRNYIIKLTIAYVIMRVSFFVPRSYDTIKNAANIISLIGMGLSTIYLNYLSHYFTEGIFLDAKAAKKTVINKPLNTAWSIFGVLIMGLFVSRVTFRSPIPETVGMFAILSSVYYVVMLHKMGSSIYGLPQKAK